MLIFRMVTGENKSEFSVEVHGTVFFGKVNGKVITKNANYDRVRETILEEARNVDVDMSKH